MKLTDESSIPNAAVAQTRPGAKTDKSAPLNPSFRLAAHSGVKKAVQIHIDRGDDVNACDHRGWTPLMVAASRDHVAVCCLLLEAGADPLYVSPSGEDATTLALSSGAHNAARAIGQYCDMQEISLPGKSILVSASAGHAPQQKGEVERAQDLTKRHTATQNHILDFGGDDVVADDEWTPATESALPKIDTDLRALVSKTHEQITSHRPVDSRLTSWDDLDVYLPDKTDGNFGELSPPAVAAIRQLLLRVAREGSIPLDTLEQELVDQGFDPQVELQRLVTQVINDLGGELDDRLEIRGHDEDFRVAGAQRESEAEEALLDEASQYLSSLLDRSNDPARLFAKSAHHFPLLSAEDEVTLAQSIELNLEQALDALAEWPDGLAHFLDLCGEVEQDRLPINSVCSSRGSPLPDGDSNMRAPSGIESNSREPTEPEANELGAAVYKEDGDELDEGLTLDREFFLSRLHRLREATRGMESNSHDKALTRALLAELSISRDCLRDFPAEAASPDTGANAFHSRMKQHLQARDRFILSNLRLVVPIARHYLRDGIEFSDLLQEGHIGLIKAADKFDWRRGFKFSTMATWWIRQQVSRAAPELSRLIRLPVHAVEVTWKILKETKQYEVENLETPSLSWLSQKLDVPVKKLEAYARTSSEPLSLDSLQDEIGVLHEVGSDPEEFVYGQERSRLIDELLTTLGGIKLNTMNEKVLRMRFGIGTNDSFTLEEIGGRYELTRERIRQIESKSLRLLKHRLKSFRLAEDPDPEQATVDPEPAKFEALPLINETRRASREDTSFTADVQRCTPPRRAPTTVVSVSAPDQPRPSSPAVSAHGKPFTEEQLDLLQQARSMGIQIMSFLDGGKYRTLVMMPETFGPEKTALARKLREGGFSSIPGRGFSV